MVMGFFYVRAQFENSQRFPEIPKNLLKIVFQNS